MLSVCKGPCCRISICSHADTAWSHPGWRGRPGGRPRAPGTPVIHSSFARKDPSLSQNARTAGCMYLVVHCTRHTQQRPGIVKGRNKRQRNALESARLAREVVFSVGGAPLESVSVFQYLGRPLSSTDNDWPAIYKNLSKALKRWGMVSRVLTREGADPRVWLCSTRLSYSRSYYTAAKRGLLRLECWRHWKAFTIGWRVGFRA